MNPISELANNTGSGAFTEAGNLMDGPVGYAVFFGIGVSVIATVAAVVKRFL